MMPTFVDVQFAAGIHTTSKTSAVVSSWRLRFRKNLSTSCFQKLHFMFQIMLRSSGCKIEVQFAGKKIINIRESCICDVKGSAAVEEPDPASLLGNILVEPLKPLPKNIPGHPILLDWPCTSLVALDFLWSNAALCFCQYQVAHACSHRSCLHTAVR